MSTFGMFISFLFRKTGVKFYSFNLSCSNLMIKFKRLISALFLDLDRSQERYSGRRMKIFIIEMSRKCPISSVLCFTL